MQGNSPQRNAELLRCLEAIRPENLSTNEWLRRAQISSSFMTGLKNGREPGVYKVERLIAVAGISLSRFWRMVERERKKNERDGAEKHET